MRVGPIYCCMVFSHACTPLRTLAKQLLTMYTQSGSGATGLLAPTYSEALMQSGAVNREDYIEKVWRMLGACERTTQLLPGELLPLDLLRHKGPLTIQT